MADFEQLQAFVAAVETGSFSAAARRLGKAQSAVSTAISNLEIDLDINLFDRTGYRPELTEAGTRLLRHAQSVLEEVNALHVDAQALNDQAEPRFSLFVEQGLMVPRMRGLVARLAETFPTIELNFAHLPRPAIVSALRTSQVDLALITGADRMEGGFRTRGIGFQRLVPVCKSDHPLSVPREISRGDLKRHRHIVGPSGPDVPTTRRALSPKIWTVEDPQTQLECVVSGLGWAECPVDMVAELVTDGILAVMEYAFEQNAILDTVGVVTSNKPVTGPVQNWVLEQLAHWDQKAWVGPPHVGRKQYSRTTPTSQK